jgi:microsomal epoxide hydrolase
VPVAVAYFRQDPAPPLRLFGGLERSTIRQWATFDDGGHFGPLEQPGPFVQELRTFAASLDS